MKLYVCYIDYSSPSYSELTEPKAVFDNLEKVEDWMKKNGIYATYEVLELNEEKE